MDLALLGALKYALVFKEQGRCRDRSVAPLAQQLEQPKACALPAAKRRDDYASVEDKAHTRRLLDAEFLWGGAPSQEGRGAQFQACGAKLLKPPELKMTETYPTNQNHLRPKPVPTWGQSPHPKMRAQPFWCILDSSG